MSGIRSMDDPSRRSEVERLLALADGMLDREREQIVRDYLAQALNALAHIQQEERAKKSGVSSG